MTEKIQRNSNQNQNQQYQQNIEIDIFCQKHPTKRLEFFCISNQYQERLFCSNCILKNAMPCKQQDLIDIQEYLEQQKQIQESKGLNQYPQLNKYLQDKKKRENEYSSKVQEEYQKFNDYVTLLQDRINNAFKSFKKVVENEFISKENKFFSQNNSLFAAIHSAYSTSLLGNYHNFHEILGQFDLNNQQGLKDLMIALIEDERNRMEQENEIKREYQNVQTLEREIYRISEEQLGGIEKLVKQVEEQIGTTIANLPSFIYLNSAVSESNKIDLTSSQFYQTSSNLFQQQQQSVLNESALNQSVMMNQTIAQMQENALQSVKISDLRKIVCSADFVSGHTRQINSICAYAQNKVATGGEDNTIRLWDLESMECLASLRGHTQGIRQLISLPNGYLISASYDKFIKLWNTSSVTTNNPSSNPSSPNNQNNLNNNYQDTTNQCLVKTLKGHLSGVICLLYLGGQLLASGSADYTIKVWDLDSGETLKTISGHTGEVLCLCQPFKGILNPKKYPEYNDSRCLISGSSDKTIKVWKINKKTNKGQELRTLTGHKDYVMTIVMLTDDSTVVSGSYDKSIILWNIHNGNILAQLNGHNSYITNIQLYAEKIILSSSTDGTLKLWDVNINSCIHTLEGHSGTVNNFCILPNHSIWSVGSDKNVHVWD